MNAMIMSLQASIFAFFTGVVKPHLVPQGDAPGGGGRTPARPPWTSKETDFLTDRNALLRDVMVSEGRAAF